MATRRRFANASRLPARQPTNWARGFSTGGNYVTVAAGTKVLLGSFLPLAGINETIRRTRGVFSVKSDQVTVAETQSGAFGMVVVTDAALAIGITAIPGPVTDAGDDGWFVWEPFFRFGAPAGSGPDPGGESAIFVDSKAMRKLPDGFSAAIVVENANATFGFDVGFGLALLGGRN